MSSTDCAICYEAVTAATGRSVMSCGHEFHMRCIVQWLQKPDGTGNCPCCRAEPGELERLVAAPADSDSDSESSDYESEDATDVTPLMEAIRTDGLTEVRRIIATGVNLEDKDSDGDTALLYAVIYSEDEMATALLEAGADITALAKLATDQTTDMFGAALLGACQYDSLPAAKAALAAGANPNYAHPTTGITPLIEVVRGEGGVEIVDLLLTKGASVHAVDADGWNVFMWFAQESSDTDIMSSLMKAMGLPLPTAAVEVTNAVANAVAVEVAVEVEENRCDWFMSRMMTVV